MAGGLSGRADSCRSAPRPAYTTRDLALASPAGAVCLMGDMEAANQGGLAGDRGLTRSRNRRRRLSCGSPPRRWCRASRVWCSIIPQPASARRERRQARIQTAIPLGPWRFARPGGQRKTGPLIAPVANVARAQSCKHASVPPMPRLSAVMDKNQKERQLKSKRDHSPYDRMEWTSTRHGKCLSVPEASRSSSTSRRRSGGLESARQLARKSHGFMSSYFCVLSLEYPPALSSSI
jgi:hypothetical protein